MNWTEKFFGYYLNGDGQYGPYNNELGGGSFADLRHYLWIISIPLISWALFRYFRIHSTRARLTIVAMAYLLLVLRLSFQIIKVTYGDETPLWRFIPFHQCAVMGFILPIVVIFNIKKLKMPVYTLSLMGGIATVAFGEYFSSSFMPFYTYEGVISHSILIFIPIIELGSREFTFDIKKSWTVIIGMLVLLSWASLANEVFFRAYNTNYMYLKASGFPDGFGGRYYFGIYVIIFFLVFACIFGPSALKYRKEKKN